MRFLIQNTNLKFHTRGRDKLIWSDLLNPPGIFIKSSVASLPQIPVPIHRAEWGKDVEAPQTAHSALWCSQKQRSKSSGGEGVWSLYLPRTLDGHLFHHQSVICDLTPLERVVQTPPLPEAHSKHQGKEPVVSTTTRKGQQPPWEACQNHYSPTSIPQHLFWPRARQLKRKPVRWLGIKEPIDGVRTFTAAVTEKVWHLAVLYLLSSRWQHQQEVLLPTGPHWQHTYTAGASWFNFLVICCCSMWGSVWPPDDSLNGRRCLQLICKVMKAQ